MNNNAEKILRRYQGVEPPSNGKFSLLAELGNPHPPHPLQNNTHALNAQAYAKLMVVTLWQELITCEDNERKEKLISELITLLNLENKNQELIKASFIGYPKTWLKKQFSGIAALQIKLISDALDEQNYIIPASNKRSQYIHHLIRKTLALHEKEPTDETSTLLYYLNQIRFDINNPHLQDYLKQIYSEINNSPFQKKGSNSSPEARELLEYKKSLLAYINKKNQFYDDLYISIQYTFEQVLNNPYKTLIKKDPHIDLDTYFLLQSMVSRIGGHDYITVLYKNIFSNNANNNLSKKERLNELLDTLHTDFLDTQQIDFKSKVFESSTDPTKIKTETPDLIDKFNIDEKTKQHSILKPWKHLLNYWATRKGLGKFLHRRSKLAVLMDTCIDLDEQLQHLFVVYPHLKKEKSYLKKKADELDEELSKTKKQLRLIRLLKKYPNNSEQVNNRLKQEAATLLPAHLDIIKLYFKQNRNLQEQHKLHNFFEEEKKKLFYKLKDIRNELINTLDDTHLEYTEHVHPYKSCDKSSVSYKKHENYQKKQNWSKRKKFFIGSLALGEAAMSTYAFIVFFPLIPIVGAFTLHAALPVGFLVFLSCYILYRTATNATINQIFVKGDIWNGFTSPSGKALMIFTWITAFFIALTLSALALLSISSIVMGTGFPLLFLVAGHLIAGIVTIGTFFCATSLYYYIISNNLISFCNFLERLCPNIPLYGWGLTGLYKGIRDGLISFNTRMKNTGGYWGNFKRVCQSQLEYYLTNPTGDPNSTTKEKWEKSIEHLLGTALKIFFIAAALGLVMLGTWALLHVWQIEISLFLSGTLQFTNQVSNIISYAIVFSFTFIAESIFNLTSYLTFFSKLANTTNRFINDYPIHYLFHPSEILRDTQIWCRKIKSKATTFYNNLKVDPRTTLVAAAKKVVNFIILPFAVICNALTTSFLIGKNSLPHEVDLVTPLSSLDALDYAFAIGAGGVIGSCASLETLEAINDQIPTHVPLLAARDALTCAPSSEDKPVKREWIKTLEAEYPEKSEEPNDHSYSSYSPKNLHY